MKTARGSFLLLGVSFLLISFQIGCKEDVCKGLPAEAQIDVSLQGIDSSKVKTTEVKIIVNNTNTVTRRFNIPTPSFVFEFKTWDQTPRKVTVRATSYDASSKALGTGQITTNFEGNGCNHFTVAVKAGGAPVDAGIDGVVPDAPRPDIQINDTGKPDVIKDTAIPDIGGKDAPIPPDQKMPDTKSSPDTKVPPDKQPPPDSKTPDVQIPPDQSSVMDVSLPPDMMKPDAPKPTCADKIRNGLETDVDCGGGTCPKCIDTKKCLKVTDCLSGVCSGTCQKGCVHQPVTKNCTTTTYGVFCNVPSGCFTMGSPTSEACREPSGIAETQHQVTLTRGFEIQSTEVTQAQFQQLMGYSPSYFSATGGGANCGSDCPVETVSWYEAAAYCNALSKKYSLTPCYKDFGSGKKCTKDSDCGTKERCMNKTSCIKYDSDTAYIGTKVYSCPGYRLPTEAEWEYAYRAGTTTAYYSGANDKSLCTSCTSKDTNLDSIAWYCVNASSTTHPVGKKVANSWGLFDMAGNAQEWCHDPGGKVMGSSPETDPCPSTGPGGRVIRGGAWNNNADDQRAAMRSAKPAHQGFASYGFRCIKTAH